MACGSDVALGNPSDLIVNATIYRSGAQPDQESITSESLESRPQQCPPYGKTSMAMVSLQGPQPPDQLGPDTWSLGTVLSCLAQPVQAPDVTAGITVFQPNGEPESGDNSALNAQDLATHSSDFQDPTDNPVVTDLGTSMKYDRPWRGGGDVNAPDQVTESAPIQISVFEGQQIPVSISGPPSVAAGATASLSAVASGTGLSYQWTLANGSAPSSTVQDPQVTFPDSGTYTVTVLVRDDNGDVGHAQQTIQVGPPSPATSTSPQTVTTGPNKSTGTTPGGTRGGKHGGHGSPTKPTQPAGGTHAPSGTPTKQHKTSTHGTTSQTSTTQTSTTPAGGSGSGNGSSGSGSSGTNGGSGTPGSTGAATSTAPTHSPTSPHRAPTHSPRPSPPVSGASRLVAGELISDVVAIPEGASPLVHAVATATPATAPALHPPSRPSVLPIVAAVLAVLVLLGAGAQRELGLLGRWLPPHARA